MEDIIIFMEEYKVHKKLSGAAARTGILIRKNKKDI